MYLKNKHSWIFFSTIFSIASAHADLDFLHVQLLEPSQEVVIAAEYSYFDISLDLLDFASKVDSASTPEHSTASQLSVLYPITERLKLGYEYKDSSAVISRTVEPFETTTTGDAHQLHANYKIGSLREIPIYINFTTSLVQQDTLEIDCYSHSGLVLGGTCEGADIKLLDGPTYFNTGEKIYYPALTAEARAQVSRIGVEFRGEIFGILPFYQKLEYQSSKIDVSYTSKLLEIEDPVLLNASFKGIPLGETISNLSSQLPQRTPWNERAFILEFGSKIQLMESVSGSMSLKHYRINRIDYEYGVNEKDYDNNTALNLALWYQPRDHFMAYIRGEVSHHNLLGMDPLAYNRKTSKFFAQPQGTVSLGLMIKF
ncbi:MAG: hypothetical protein QNK56_04860 [Pontimonas sp.]